MLRVYRKSWLPSNLLLTMLLIGAQSGALAHAFEHDPGTLQNKACAICVTVGQLDSGAIFVPSSYTVEPDYSCQAIVQTATFESFDGLVARQRGPPTSH